MSVVSMIMVAGLNLVVAKTEPLAPALTVVSLLDGPVGDFLIVAHQLIAVKDPNPCIQ